MSSHESCQVPVPPKSKFSSGKLMSLFRVKPPQPAESQSNANGKCEGEKRSDMSSVGPLKPNLSAHCMSDSKAGVQVSMAHARPPMIKKWSRTFDSDTAGRSPVIVRSAVFRDPAQAQPPKRPVHERSSTQTSIQSRDSGMKMRIKTDSEGTNDASASRDSLAGHNSNFMNLSTKLLNKSSESLQRLKLSLVRDRLVTETGQDEDLSMPPADREPIILLPDQASDPVTSIPTYCQSKTKSSESLEKTIRRERKAALFEKPKVSSRRSSAIFLTSFASTSRLTSAGSVLPMMQLDGMFSRLRMHSMTTDQPSELSKVAEGPTAVLRGMLRDRAGSTGSLFHSQAECNLLECPVRKRGSGILDKVHKSCGSIKTVEKLDVRRFEHASFFTPIASNPDSEGPMPFMDPARKRRKGSSNSTVIVRETRTIDYHDAVQQQDKSSLAMINQYRVIKSIGEGSFAKVLLVFDPGMNLYFACKAISKKRLRQKSMWRNGPNRKKRNPDGMVTDDDRVKRFEYMDLVRREIAIMKRLSRHPNISTLLEVLDDERHDQLYLIFELCEYGSIMTLKADSTVMHFSEARSRKYFRDIVLGLEYLHSMNIVHRDMKPENILLNRQNMAVIGDFSISLYLDADECVEESWERLGSGNDVLTPSFTPPELIETMSRCAHQDNTTSSNASCVKHRKLFSTATDIWCLGLTLFCFVHGHVPYRGVTMDQLYESIRQDPIEPRLNPNLSLPLQDLLRKMLAKNPERRIPIRDIKIHPWVTKQGSDPMPSTEDNCDCLPGVGTEATDTRTRDKDTLMTSQKERQSLEMSDEEISRAIRPAVALFDRIQGLFGNHRDLLSSADRRHCHRRSLPIVDFRSNS